MIEAVLRTIDKVIYKIPYIISFQFWADEDVPADLLIIGTNSQINTRIRCVRG